MNNLPKVEVNNIDKFYHLVAYFILGILWLFYTKNTNKIFIITLIVLLIFGCLVEYFQNKINPNRAFEYADMISNSFGIILGAITTIIVLKVKSKS